METIDSWLMRNYESTLKLAKNIKEHSPPHMKVIFCTMGPACFCASIIAKVATNLNKSNIVVVSTHYGLEMLYDFVKSLDVEIKNVGCPPVWGYLGLYNIKIPKKLILLIKFCIFQALIIMLMLIML